MTDVAATENAIRQLLLSYERLDAAWRRRFSLSANEKLLVLFLMEGSTAMPAELATTIGTTTAEITALLDRLEADGFLHRERDSADDDRVLLTPTKKSLRAVMEFERVSRQLAEHSALQGEHYLDNVTDFLVTAADLFRTASMTETQNDEAG